MKNNDDASFMLFAASYYTTGFCDKIGHYRDKFTIQMKNTNISLKKKS